MKQVSRHHAQGVQLALDLFGVAAARSVFVARHQIGMVRLPYTPQGMPYTAGDLVPAWVCCRCGTPEITEFALWLNHNCCDALDGPRDHARCDLVPPAHRLVLVSPPETSWPSVRS